MNYIQIIGKGIDNISVQLGGFMEISIEHPSLDFISSIEAKEIVLNCESQEDLLEEIEDEIIYKYLEKNGIIFNKA